MATLVADFLVPGSGSIVSVLAAIWTLCNEIQEGQDACRRLHGRLSDILNELLRLEESDQLPASDVLTRYAGMLAKSLQFLTRYRNKGLMSRLTKHKRMMDELLMVNEDIDTLMKVLNIATAGMLVEWKKQWEEDCKRQEAMLAASVANDALILSEVQGSRAQQEALLLLQYQFDSRLEQQTKLILELMRTSQSTIIRASSCGVPRKPAWYLPADEVDFEAEPFARGAFGAAHHGVWGSGTKVVVKTLLVDGIDPVEGMTEAAKKKFKEEVEIWHRLHHPHVLKMYGASHMSHPPFIVCEDASLGTLAAYAKSIPTRQRMWQLLYQAALGLEYIHNNGVVHADLKANNIFIGSDGGARVADFGLSSMKDPSQSRVASFKGEGQGFVGGLRWKAPECVRGRPATFQSDLYSFAMCIIETATNAPPYGAQDDEIVAEFKRDGQIPERPRGFCDDEWELVSRMAQLEPSGRLPLVQAIHSLKQFADRDDSARDAQLAPPAPTSIRSSRPSVVSATMSSTSVRGLLQQLAYTTTSAHQETIKQLYRLLITEKVCDEVASSGRVPSLVLMAKNSASSYSSQLYGFACLHILWTSQTEGVSRQDLEDSKQQLREPSPAELDALGAWLRVSTDGNPDEEEQCLSAMEMLCCLARVSVDYRDRVREHGLLRSLINVVVAGTDTQKASAATALAALASQNESNQVALVELGGIHLLTKLVQHGTETQRWCAASALASLAGNDVNRMFIAHEGAIKPLVELVVSGGEQEKTCGARALGSLAGYSDNQVLIAQGGAIGPLVELLEQGTKFQKQVAMFALGHLVTNNDANSDAAVKSGAVKFLLELARSLVEMARVNASGVLQALASSVSRAELIANAGGADVLVDLLTVGTGEQKRSVALAFANMARDDKDTGQVSCVPAIELAAEVYVGVDDSDKESELQPVSSVAKDASVEESSATADVIEPLVALLVSGNSKQKERATIALSNLAYDDSSRVQIAHAGAVPPLVELLQSGTDKQKDNACMLLSNLSIAKKNQVMIAKTASVPLVALVNSGTELQKEKAAMALGSLSIVPARKSTVASGSIEALVKLLATGTEKQKEQAVTALGNIAYANETHAAIVQCGGIEPVIKLLHSGKDKSKEKAAIMLSNLAYNEELHERIVKAGAIAPLVDLLRAGTTIHKEKAMCALDNLANSDCNRLLIAKTDAIQLLLALKSSETHKDRANRVLTNLARNASVAHQISKKSNAYTLKAVAEKGATAIAYRAAAAVEEAAKKAKPKQLKSPKKA